MPDRYPLIKIPRARSEYVEVPVARSFANENEWYGGKYLNPPINVLSLKCNVFDSMGMASAYRAHYPTAVLICQERFMQGAFSAFPQFLLGLLAGSDANIHIVKENHLMDNLSHNLRKFNRFELKYLITLKQAAQFKSVLRAYLVPDEHGNNNGCYRE